MNLVSTTWLANHLGDPDLRIVDIRGKILSPVERSSEILHHYADYTQRHIPGAVFVNWVEDITDDPDHKRVAPLPKYANAIGKLGIANNHTVVAYDDASNTLAARLWWTLNYYGHTKVGVLDGGWQKWLDENRPTTSDIPQIDPSSFTGQPQGDLRREGDDVLKLLGGTTRIVDMRLPAEYQGQITLARFAGHIPGAQSLPVNTLLDGDNRLMPPEELRERLAAVGVDESAPEVIFYSNVGVASCLGMLAMRVAGLSMRASNYDASWQEWGNDERKPRSQE